MWGFYVENFYFNHLWKLKGWQWRKTLRRECSRSRGVDSCKRRVDIIDFQGVLLAITTPFLFIPKKNWKLCHYITTICYVCPILHFEHCHKQKTDLFPFFEKRDIARSKFELNSPFEDTYHLFCKIQPFPLPLVTWRCLRDRCRYLITQSSESNISCIVFRINRLAKWLHYLRFSITNALSSEMKVNLSTFD